MEISASTLLRKSFGININVLATLILGIIITPYIYATFLKNYSKEDNLNILNKC